MRLIRYATVIGIAALVAGTLATAGGTAAATATPTAQPQQVTQLVSLGDSRTPIKHVVVIIGENHTFDNVFAAYTPPPGQPT